MSGKQLKLIEYCFNQPDLAVRQSDQRGHPRRIIVGRDPRLIARPLAAGADGGDAGQISIAASLQTSALECDQSDTLGGRLYRWSRSFRTSLGCVWGTADASTVVSFIRC